MIILIIIIGLSNLFKWWPMSCSGLLNMDGDDVKHPHRFQYE